MKDHHGIKILNGIAPYCKRGHVQTESNRFGRLFGDLQPSYTAASILAGVGKKGGKMDAGASKSKAKTVPVGQVIFGQFVDHDITLDVTSGFGRINDPDDIPNLRTPTLDLDCIYGAGPEPHPYLYHSSGTYSGAKLLTGADETSADANAAQDLYRSPDVTNGGRGPAVIGDPRNDENRVISQMQLAMIRFHNLVCEEIHTAEGIEGGELFEAARKSVTWHYQWSVVNDFLVCMCGSPVVNDILSCGRKYYLCHGEPYIPVEFSVAAYRFGHSMVPMKIRVQKGGKMHEFFGPVLGEGFSPIESPKAVVSWSQLLKTPKGGVFQKAEKLDTKLATDLLDLPFISNGESSLAVRNLLRGNSFLLPGGEKVALRMGRSSSEISKVVNKVKNVSSNQISEGVPLWLYILAEAETVGRETDTGKFEKGEGLGPVGARIVAEVIIGFLEHDSTSYLGENRNWIPEQRYDTVGKILSSTQ